MSDEPMFAPPIPRQVGLRFLCLDMLLFRNQLEIMSLSADSNTISAMNKLISETIIPYSKDWQIWEAFSEQEKDLMPARIGQWTQQDLADASWRIESLHILVWSLGRVEFIPPYDAQSDLSDEQAKPQRADEIEPFLANATLRPQEEIEDARDLAELWHWRARTTQIKKEGTELPQGMDIDTAVKLTVQACMEIGSPISILDGDFAAFGKAYRELSEDEYSIAMSIAMERHHALNWLCGYSDNWDDVPTDT